MRIIITGGRNRETYEDIDKAFDDFIDTDGYLIPAACTIIDGACPTGVDYNAGRYATEYGFKHETYPADWDTYGKSAGPRRNEQMAQAGADICLAFPSAGKSAGTWDMIRRAANHGIKTIIIPEETK